MSIRQDSMNLPWETVGFSKEYAIAEKGGGLFDLVGWGVIEIDGPDAEDFLGRMSTLGFKQWDRKGFAHAAFLTGKGQVVALGMFHAFSGKFHFIVSPGQAPQIAEHLERFHFAEKLTIRDVSEQWSLFLVRGNPEGAVWADDLRKGWNWFKVPLAERGELLERFSNCQRLGKKLFEYYRIQAAIPQVGTEVGDAIILETGFDRAVSRNKGCYPGQEVVERIFTYGSVNRKLLRLEWNGPEINSTGVDFSDSIQIDGRTAIEIVSRIEHPRQSNAGFALGYVHKNLWDSKATWISQNQIQYRLSV